MRLDEGDLCKALVEVRAYVKRINRRVAPVSLAAD